MAMKCRYSHRYKADENIYHKSKGRACYPSAPRWFRRNRLTLHSHQMKTQLTLISNPIAETQPAMTDDMGAVVVFHGVVRGKEEGKPIRAIHYEANEPMARRQFELIFESIEQQWPIESIRLTHRVDEVAVNEASLWVEVTAPHRAEAFEACQFLIDEMKQKVPIWKRAVR